MTMTYVNCQASNGKVQCMRPSGHDDAHMHFGANGTTAWGWA